MLSVKVNATVQDKIDALPMRQRLIYERLIKVMRTNWNGLRKDIEPQEDSDGEMFVVGIRDVQLAIRFVKSPELMGIPVNEFDPDFVVLDIIYPVKHFIETTKEAEVNNDDRPKLPRRVRREIR